MRINCSAPHLLLCYAPDSKSPQAPVRRFKMELERDGFAAERNIVTDKALSKIGFTVENRTGDEHTIELLLSLPAGSSYAVLQNGTPVVLKRTGNWDYPDRAELKVGLQPATIEIVRSKNKAAMTRIRASRWIEVNRTEGLRILDRGILVVTRLRYRLRSP
jgi:hypothetical protein